MSTETRQQRMARADALLALWEARYPDVGKERDRYGLVSHGSFADYARLVIEHRLRYRASLGVRGQAGFLDARERAMVREQIDGIIAEEARS